MAQKKMSFCQLCFGLRRHLNLDRACFSECVVIRLMKHRPGYQMEVFLEAASFKSCWFICFW
jgi:hypothetical protein